VIGWDVITDVDVDMDLSLNGRHCLIIVANWGQIKSVYLLLRYLLITGMTSTNEVHLRA